MKISMIIVMNINGENNSVWSLMISADFWLGYLSWLWASLPTNYRGISLNCVTAKVYNRMLLNRLRPYIEPILRNNQNGFRPGRSTLTQILALRRVIEGVKEKNLPEIFLSLQKSMENTTDYWETLWISNGMILLQMRLCTKALNLNPFRWR